MSGNETVKTKMTRQEIHESPPSICAQHPAEEALEGVSPLLPSLLTNGKENTTKILKEKEGGDI